MEADRPMHAAGWLAGLGEGMKDAVVWRVTVGMGGEGGVVGGEVHVGALQVAKRAIFPISLSLFLLLPGNRVWS